MNRSHLPAIRVFRSASRFSYGGGYGSPLARPAQKVLEDVLDGFYSADHARDVYGVAVNVEEETVDMEETSRLRTLKSGS